MRQSVSGATSRPSTTREGKNTRWVAVSLSDTHGQYICAVAYRETAGQFLNGVKSRVQNPVSHDGTEALLLLGAPYASGHLANVHVASARVYSEALSDEEIVAHSNSQPGSFCQSLSVEPYNCPASFMVDATARNYADSVQFCLVRSALTPLPSICIPPSSRTCRGCRGWQCITR